jgi:arylformamidase
VAPGFGGDVDRLVTTGWSAGGHLTALSQTHPRVHGGVTMSGIFDLEPIRLNYLNDKLHLTEVDVTTLSPIHRNAELTNPLVVCCGGDELPELVRQSATFAQARAELGLPGDLRVLAGHNHFSILEELASPTGIVASALIDLVTSA